MNNRTWLSLLFLFLFGLVFCSSRASNRKRNSQAALESSEEERVIFERKRERLEDDQAIIAGIRQNNADSFIKHFHHSGLNSRTIYKVLDTFTSFNDAGSIDFILRR